RPACPREAVWQAIVCKNYGCSHLIVDRSYTELFRKYQADLEIEMVPGRTMVYVDDSDTFVPEDEIPSGVRTRVISDAELRKRLSFGQDIPEWFTFPAVSDELRRSHPPRSRQGFTVFFTGLSGAGKSTIAKA